MSKYLHASNPRALSKFRPETESGQPANIMFDKRVYRGPTVVNSLLASKLESTEENRNVNTRKPVEPKYQDYRTILDSAMSVKENASDAVPLHLYLEEQVDDIEVVNEEAQTDEFLDLPPQKPYVRAKVGVDVRIQVDPTLVYNFYQDVDIITNNFVSKTIDQAVVELSEEIQISTIRKSKEKLLNSKKSYQATMRAAEMHELRNVKQDIEVSEIIKKKYLQEQRLVSKISAQCFAKSYLHYLQDDVISQLKSSNLIADPIRNEISNQFMPWLRDQVKQKVQNASVSDQLLDDMITRSSEKLLHSQHLQLEKIPFRLYIHWNDSKGVVAPVGPIEVRSNATMGDVHSEVLSYLCLPLIAATRKDLVDLIAAARVEQIESVKRIKFVIGIEEIPDDSLLKVLAASGKLQKIEMKIELASGQEN